MGNLGPVYIVDDDTDYQQLIKEIWQDLKIEHPLRFFDNGKEVLHHYWKIYIAKNEEWGCSILL